MKRCQLILLRGITGINSENHRKKYGVEKNVEFLSNY